MANLQNNKQSAALADNALDKMAENAREIGLDYGLEQDGQCKRCADGCPACDARKQPAQQEPVAWMYPDDYERMTTSETFCTVFSVECGSPTQGKTTIALYDRPQAPEPVIDKSAAIRIATALGWEPKREWVRLTFGESLDILQKHKKIGGAMGAVEKILREKNT